MSIDNRSLISRNNIIDQSESTLSLKSQVEPNPGSNKWTIVFIDIKRGEINGEIDDDFYKITIESIKQKLIIQNIYIYTHDTNRNRFDFLIKSYSAQIINIPITSKPKSFIISTVKKLIDDKNNIILLRTGYGYLSNKNDPIIIDNNIYANFTSTDSIMEFYGAIINKLKITELITSEIMIIPYNTLNQKYINSAHDISNQLTITDEHFVTSISLTIANIKYGNIVKDINQTLLGNTFVSYLNNKSNLNTIRELQLLSAYFFNTDLIVKEIIPYDNPYYVYYPYLDIDATPEKLDNRYINSNNEYRVVLLEECEYNPSVFFDPITCFNTNGFFPKYDQSLSLNQAMFKRFNDKNSGIFVKKNLGKNIIPKILHHVWLGEEPNQSCVNSWKRILREPWEYIIWTEDIIKKDILTGEWSRMYNNENNYDVKLLIVYFAILEKYGGIVISFYSIPLKLIPDDFLVNKFFVSFKNEYDSGTSLSYRIIGSVPGITRSTTKNIDYDAARRPFEGINNFFREVKLQSNPIKAIISDQIEYPQLYIQFKRILTMQKDRLSALHNYLMSNVNVMIYPSYYFDPNINLFPKKVSKLAVCINLWKSLEEETYEKTDLIRINKLATPGIIARLKENPRDRLKNYKQFA